MSCELFRDEALSKLLSRTAKDLFHTQHLEVEEEFRVGRNLRWCPFTAIGKIGRNGQSSLAPNSHTHYANIPAFDDFTSAKFEAKRFALFVRFISSSVSRWSVVMEKRSKM